MNKELELEKLKFQYKYLNDTEKHNFFVFTFVVAILTIPSFISGKGTFQIIGVIISLMWLVFIILGIKKAQVRMQKIFSKIQNLN